MNLHNKRILFAAQYAAPYLGNFVNSLVSLEQRLKESYNSECAYLFPVQAKEREWFASFASSHKVFLSGDSYVLITSEQAQSIIAEYRPDIIHTHFEGYDMPLSEAVRVLGSKAKVVFHMHDWLSYLKNPLKNIVLKWIFFRHYGLPVIRASKRNRPAVIAVCNHELRFIKPFLLGRRIICRVIPNGIDLQRLRKRPHTSSNRFRFLVFGGRNEAKRADLVIKALPLLKGDYEVKIVSANESALHLKSLIDRVLPPPPVVA